MSKSWYSEAADSARRLRYQHVISALAIPGGNAEEAYLEAVRGAFDLYTSVAVLTETARNCRLCDGQRGNVIDLTLDVPRSLPQVNRALGIQPELGAVAK